MATRSFSRPDLSRRTLLTLLGVLAPVVLLVLFLGGGSLPGTPLRQSAALIGGVLLLTPFFFSIAKRAGLTASPPAWFVAHVLGSTAGTVLVTWHMAGGAWLSPPGVLFLALLFLVFQGLSARAFLALDSSRLFAAQVSSFARPDPQRQQAIAGLIDDKQRLLARLAPDASEALFSPHLGHWLRHPMMSLAYSRLAAAEARLVGSRASAGPVLAYWRRLHMAVATVFLVGLILHVSLVTLFAGFVSGGDDIYWWHLADWGGPG